MDIACQQLGPVGKCTMLEGMGIVRKVKKGQG